MTETEMFAHLLRRPELYLPKRSGECLIAFIAGLEWSAHHSPAGRSKIGLLLGDLLADFPERYQATSLSLPQVLRQMTHGDDEAAFELLKEKLQRHLARLDQELPLETDTRP